MTATPRRRLGDAGEGHARRYLESRGLRFVARQWRCAAGELDLVMRDGEEVVFVEVKTRHGEAMGRAEEAVSPRQSARLLAAAARFLDERTDLDDVIWRIDLVAITLAADGRVARLAHVENAVVVG